jgi:hypothetical protein
MFIYPKAMHGPKEIGLIMVGYGEANGQKGLHFKRGSCSGGGGGGFHRRNLGSMLGNRTWNTEPCNQAIRAVVALYA